MLQALRGKRKQLAETLLLVEVKVEIEVWVRTR